MKFTTTNRVKNKTNISGSEKKILVTVIKISVLDHLN